MVALWEAFSIENNRFDHLEGAQPVPHPDFEIQRFPKTVRRYLWGPGPHFRPNLGIPGARADLNNTCFSPLKLRNCIFFCPAPFFEPDLLDWVSGPSLAEKRPKNQHLNFNLYVWA